MRVVRDDGSTELKSGDLNIFIVAAGYDELTTIDALPISILRFLAMPWVSMSAKKGRQLKKVADPKPEPSLSLSRSTKRQLTTS